MGKRRKRGIYILNFNRPQRKFKARSMPDKLKLNRYDVFQWLLNNVAGENSGKYLEERCSRGDYYWYERDREQDQSYYKVRVKGNYITVHRYRWELAGQGINTFVSIITGLEKEPVFKRELILRHPISEWRTFKEAYAEAAPMLDVW